MPRSGSHYLQMLLGNYWNLTYLDSESRLGFKEIKEDIWNSEFDLSKNAFTAAKKALLDSTKFSDIVFEHFNPFLPLYKSKKILFLYRNPLDNMVSRYFFFYVNRQFPKYEINSIKDMLPIQMPYFIKHYTQMKRMENKPNVKLVSYEKLLTDPKNTLIDIINFLDEAVIEDNIQKAIEYSAPKTIIQDEKKHSDGKDTIGNNMKTSFIRNPEVGQWQSHIDNETLESIKQYLTQKNIQLEEFHI